MPEPDEHASDVWFSRHRFAMSGGWIIFCAVLAFGLKYWPPIMDFAVLPVLIILFASPSIYKELKYDTQTQIVADNMHFSFNTDDLFREGRFVLMRGGGINAGMFSLKGREGTIIVPEELVHDNGHAIVIRANLVVEEYSALLPEVRRIIDTHHLPKPYFWSIVPTYELPTEVENKKKLESLMDLQPKYSNLNRRITELETMLGGKFKDLRKLFRHIQGIVGESWKDKVRNLMTKSSKDDNQ